MNLSKNKVLAGVIGLIAVVGIANTQAILSLTDYVKGDSAKVAFSVQGQEAQLVSAGSNCVRILPASSNHTSFIDPAPSSDFDGLSRHMFVIGFKIKNTCNRSISIIKDSFVSTNTISPSFEVTKLEDFPNISAPSISSGYTVSGPYPGTMSDIYGLAFTSLTIPNSNISGVPLTGDGEMKVTHIPANGEKEFIIYSTAQANSQGLEHNTRLSLKNVRWFLTQSYNDQNLSSNEVKVYNLNRDEVARYSTSYARFKNSCGPGTIIGYDASGNPIYCDGANFDGEDLKILPEPTRAEESLNIKI